MCVEKERERERERERKKERKKERDRERGAKDREKKEIHSHTHSFYIIDSPAANAELVESMATGKLIRLFNIMLFRSARMASL